MPRSSATDSPWFWAYVFGLSALCLAWWAAPTWVARQTRLERRVIVQEANDSNNVALNWESEKEARARSLSRLRQILVFLGALVTVGWVGWIWKRRQEARQLANESVVQSPP